MALTALTKIRDAIATRLRLRRGSEAAGADPPFGPSQPDASTLAPHDRFVARARQVRPDARVLEVGTKQSIEGRVTHVHGHFELVPRANYTMADVEAGNDVDVIADLHSLPVEWTNRFAAVVAISVFEHLERPWIAAREIARVLKPGGFCFIATHQTFPLHGYPSDFFRFSKEALTLIFEDAGLNVAEAGYQFRTKISVPDEIVPSSYHEAWNGAFPSYMAVNLFAEKRS
ncbi:MAG: class I SAM-dependent methyltransferase [Methylobacteriaceae bacterium]|nr:class I SAM-dependent methyltransferase [Methylobacteriaceae bacterium]MBV9393931.1 class I SAM-dependent methyltransferase [Methylobacteriaceae bacterium]